MTEFILFHYVVSGGLTNLFIMVFDLPKHQYSVEEMSFRMRWPLESSASVIEEIDQTQSNQHINCRRQGIDCDSQGLYWKSSLSNKTGGLISDDHLQ